MPVVTVKITVALVVLTGVYGVLVLFFNQFHGLVNLFYLCFVRCLKIIISCSMCG